MEEKYNWIKCRYKGKEIFVRQSSPHSQVFLDEKMYTHTLDELDFTQVDDNFKQFQESMRKSNEESEKMQQQMREMLASMDARAIADHQAKIDERKYWRELRGNILLGVLKCCDKITSVEEFDWATKMTKRVFNSLYEQNEAFFKNK